MEKLQILMSVYNGKKYLREQLESIMAQDCEKDGTVVFSLVIRDDGSSDGTQEILEEYTRKYPNKVRWYQGNNLGVIQSFFDLMVKADNADYYALADQDDYWLPSKMGTGIKRIRQIYKEQETLTDRPVLYCCRPSFVDENLEHLELKVSHPDMRPGFGNALIENIVTGCTTVFNNKLRVMVADRFPEYTTMHDRWLYLVSSCFGRIYYDENSYIYYRQHGGNTVGKNTDRLAEIKYRLNKFRKDAYSSSRQAAEFWRVFGKGYKGMAMPTGKKRLLVMFIKGKKDGHIRRRLVNTGKIYRQRELDNKIFKILLRLGIY